MTTKLRAVLDHVLFQFEDELGSAQGVKQFRETTKWGFVVGSNFDHNLKVARWVHIVAVGPNVTTELKPGMRVLVEPLKWTEAVQFEGQSYWMTKEDNVLMVDDAVKV